MKKSFKESRLKVWMGIKIKNIKLLYKIQLFDSSDFGIDWIWILIKIGIGYCFRSKVIFRN